MWCTSLFKWIIKISLGYLKIPAKPFFSPKHFDTVYGNAIILYQEQQISGLLWEVLNYSRDLDLM